MSQQRLPAWRLALPPTAVAHPSFEAAVRPYHRTSVGTLSPHPRHLVAVVFAFTFGVGQVAYVGTFGDPQTDSTAMAAYSQAGPDTGLVVN